MKTKRKKMVESRESWSPRRPRVASEKRKNQSGLSVIRGAKLEPLFFTSEVLGHTLWEKQAEILRAIRDHERVCVRSGYATGKTFAVADAVLWFLFSFASSKVITTAPTWRQVDGILWGEIRSAWRRARYPLGGELLQTRLKVDDDWFAIGLSTDESERFQGFHAPHLLVVFDEAPGISKEIWDAAEGQMAGAHVRWLAVGNPTSPSGPFFECFKSEAWHKIHISCLDVPKGVVPGLVTQEWIDERKRDWGETSPLYQARVLGEFPQESETTLIPLAWLENSAECRVQSAESNLSLGTRHSELGTLFLGVDVARFGGDESVFLVRDDAGVIHIEAYQGLSTMEVCGRARQVATRFAISAEHIFVDDTGVGSGVTDRLKELGLKVTPVILGAGAEDKEHFVNSRAELFWRIREVLNPQITQIAPLEARGTPTPEGPINLSVNLAKSVDEISFSIPKSFERLHAQLSDIRFEYTSRGQVKIEAKEEIKSRTGRSPDHADALALTFARPEVNEQPRVWVV